MQNGVVLPRLWTSDDDFEAIFGESEVRIKRVESFRCVAKRHQNFGHASVFLIQRLQSHQSGRSVVHAHQSGNRQPFGRLSTHSKRTECRCLFAGRTACPLDFRDT